MHFIGYDIGSSSVKASIINGYSGECLASAYYPRQEMELISRQAGWAEQDPDEWWKNLRLATAEILSKSGVKKDSVKAVGISYQMHGLVLVDKNRKILRPSIIWCDSRAIDYGDKAFKEIGKENCLSHLLNSPGNFTASKLKWVMENEPEVYSQVFKFMLPGDYIAMRLTGEIQTTVSGLSEGILWDFKENNIAEILLRYYGIAENLIPDIVPTFSIQGKICRETAEELGLSEDTLVTYRAGDQLNNAFSLNVLNPGEVAANAGTSGVIYGVSNEVKFDPLSRVNTFAHVNHSEKLNRLGILLCINGTGILNSWAKRNIGNDLFSYDQINTMAATVKPGSDGLIILPFGNGSERILENRNIGSVIFGLNFNHHRKEHIFRAVQEGIVFSLFYGIEIMKEMGVAVKIIRAGNANMFLSPVFRETLANISGAVIELYNTDGSLGAARGAAVGAGFYKSFDEAFNNLKIIKLIEPVSQNDIYVSAYNNWIEILKNIK